MEGQIFKSVRDAVKYWWVSLLIGILAIVVGVWCIATPDTTFVALIYLFIFGFLFSGVLEIIFAVSNRNRLSDWGWSLASGIIEVVLGLLLMFLPMVSIGLILIYFVGFWILFRSVWMIAESFELKRLNIKGWGWFLGLGILVLIFSFIFILSPIFSGIFIVAFISAAFIVYGISRIYLAFQLRSIHKDVEKINNQEF